MSNQSNVQQICSYVYMKAFLFYFNKCSSRVLISFPTLPTSLILLPLISVELVQSQQQRTKFGPGKRYIVFNNAQADLQLVQTKEISRIRMTYTCEGSTPDLLIANYLWRLQMHLHPISRATLGTFASLPTQSDREGISCLLLC